MREFTALFVGRKGPTDYGRYCASTIHHPPRPNRQTERSIIGGDVQVRNVLTAGPIVSRKEDGVPAQPQAQFTLAHADYSLSSPRNGVQNVSMVQR